MLVAPLNWGLGHATRCIPIVNALIQANFEPIIAGEGNALTLLQKEFPQLKSYVLPAYAISYSKKGSNLKWHLLKQLPRLFSIIKKEKRIVAEIVDKEQLSGIISDNRFGVFHAKTPSVYITHQMNVLSGNTTWFTSKTHQRFMNNFDEIWIPDTELNGYSGKLSNLSLRVNFCKKFVSRSELKDRIKFIGILSRFNPSEHPKKYDLLVLLSGPEPQRTLLEQKLLTELQNFKGNTLFVRGVFKEEKLKNTKYITFINYLLSSALEIAIQQSKLVICRSGYSTILDLAKLGAKALFIPTPGQFEQEYLAKHLESLKIAPFTSQGEFKTECFKEVIKYSGFKKEKETFDLRLFQLFKGKSKF